MSFRASTLFSNEVWNVSHGASIEIEVENASSEVVTFDPKKLAMIDKSHVRAEICCLDQNTEDLLFVAMRRNIAPKAIFKERYILSNRIGLPGGVYYDDKLLGTING
jgi:hypothetical protein